MLKVAIWEQAQQPQGEDDTVWSVVWMSQPFLFLWFVVEGITDMVTYWLPAPTTKQYCGPLRCVLCDSILHNTYATRAELMGHESAVHSESGIDQCKTEGCLRCFKSSGHSGPTVP